MTPLAQSLWQRARDNNDRQLIGDMLSGCEFFNCEALVPFIESRMAMDDAKMATLELAEGKIPASRTWLDYGKKAVLLSDDPLLLAAEPTAIMRALVVSGARSEFSAFIFRDGSIKVPHATAEYNDDKALQSACELIIRAAWFSIEAMQTPGMTHRVHARPSRQQARAAMRAGKPCHKFVEIRLGRGPKIGGSSCGKTGRTVAWHYRRGHRINHPYPNFPKWRKGCWVGDTDAGIRTHNYVIEVPEWS